MELRCMYWLNLQVKKLIYLMDCNANHIIRRSAIHQFLQSRCGSCKPQIFAIFYTGFIASIFLNLQSLDPCNNLSINLNNLFFYFYFYCSMTKNVKKGTKEQYLPDSCLQITIECRTSREKIEKDLLANTRKSPENW